MCGLAACLWSLPPRAQTLIPDNLYIHRRPAVMAAPTESLLSLGHLTGTERNTFTKHREYSLKNSRVMLLQQRWQELKERELTAQQHNRQLLQQFERTQDTLREMLARNAAMKTIRMEYERYLEESAPRWQQQLKEKTQAAQRKRMEEYLRSCLKNTEQEQMTNPSADRPLLSQGLTNKPQKVSTPQEKNQSSHSDYNQDVSSHLPYVKSSWLTHTPSQSARFPIRGPSQPQDSSHVPPSYLPPSYIFPHPHQFQLQHLASTSTHHPPWPRQNTPGWGPTQPDYPCSWTTGAAGIPPGSEALWGQLYMEEPPPDRRVEAETSRAPSSKRERGGGSRSSCFSQELDIKPGGKRKLNRKQALISRQCVYVKDMCLSFLNNVSVICVYVDTVSSSSVQWPCREQREQQGLQSGQQREEEEEGEERKNTAHLLRKVQL
ncbi:uncharacterized protein [Trachinotus anak]|uniref:uncharacterized protein isoform X2 n=1 Tax=Trachinotus anak TaxID=443729 RepID=UPI0039F17102